MKITFCEYEYTRVVHTKEVHSNEYEEKLKFLILLKKLGYMRSIEKYYSETGWTLIGYTNENINGNYYYTGEWDKESD